MRLFDNDIKTEGEVSTAKIIPIMVSFMMRMEAAVVDIWKLVSGSPTGSSQTPPPPPKETPKKEKPLDEVKTPLLQWVGKESAAEVARMEVPIVEFPAAASTAKAKKTEKDSDTKTTNFEPSTQSRRSRRKVKKEPSLESEEEEESTEGTGSFGGDDEEEPTILPLDKRQRMDTKASHKKKSSSAFKTTNLPKHSKETPKKGESSQKKLRGK